MFEGRVGEEPDLLFAVRPLLCDCISDAWETLFFRDTCFIFQGFVESTESCVLARQSHVRKQPSETTLDASGNTPFLVPLGRAVALCTFPVAGAPFACMQRVSCERVGTQELVFKVLQTGCGCRCCTACVQLASSNFAERIWSRIDSHVLARRAPHMGRPLTGNSVCKRIHRPQVRGRSASRRS